MEQSLREHKDYIIAFQEKNVRQTVHYERMLSELSKDKERWKAQCLARQLYIKHETKQLFKAVCKAHEMVYKAKALHQDFIPTGRNGQNC